QHEREQGERRERGAPGDLRGRRRVELPLGEPGGRPGNRGDRDRELTLSGPPLLEPGASGRGRTCGCVPSGPQTRRIPASSVARYLLVSGLPASFGCSV